MTFTCLLIKHLIILMHQYDMLNNKKDNEDNEFQTITRHGLTWLNIRDPDSQKIDALAEEYPNFHRLNSKTGFQIYKYRK
jgi:hypothetical protein